jgi:hypothetical protein
MLRPRNVAYILYPCPNEYLLYLPPGKIVSKVPVQPVFWNTFGISIGVTVASGNGACCRTLSTQILQRPVTSRL